MRLVFADAMADTRDELDRFGITDLVGTDAYFDSVAAVVDAFEAAPGRADEHASSDGTPPPTG